jgi:hypothetical protein
MTLNYSTRVRTSQNIRLVLHAGLTLSLSEMQELNGLTRWMPCRPSSGTL